MNAENLFEVKQCETKFLHSNKVVQTSMTLTYCCWRSLYKPLSCGLYLVFHSTAERPVKTWPHISLKPTRGNIKAQSSLHCSTGHFVLPPQISKILIFHWFFKCNFAQYILFLYFPLYAISMRSCYNAHLYPETHWQKLRHQQLPKWRKNNIKIKRLKAEEQDDEAEKDYL